MEEEESYEQTPPKSEGEGEIIDIGGDQQELEYEGDEYDYDRWIEDYELEGEELEEVEEEERFVSIFEILDAPRVLPEPIKLEQSHIDQISRELGLIRLCWPDIKEVTFENRTNFPESYLTNNNKEKLLLFYTESFRKQFQLKNPPRKPLFLAAYNECGQQKMVCTTVTPTKLPHTEIEQWQGCASFVADHLEYEPLESPTLIVSYARGGRPGAPRK